MGLLPDFLYFQEVDHFEFLQKTLSTQGYQGIFFPKPDSPCLYVKENNGPDGCAIFYSKNRFKELRSQTTILPVWTINSNQVRCHLWVDNVGCIFPSATMNFLLLFRWRFLYY